MHISRRTALTTTAAALATAPALANSAHVRNLAGSDARLLDLERRYERVVQYINDTAMTDDEVDRAGEVEDAVEAAILATSAVGCAGLMVKWYHTADHLASRSIWAEEWADDFESNLRRIVGRAS